MRLRLAVSLTLAVMAAVLGIAPFALSGSLARRYIVAVPDELAKAAVPVELAPVEYSQGLFRATFSMRLGRPEWGEAAAIVLRGQVVHRVLGVDVEFESARVRPADRPLGRFGILVDGAVAGAGRYRLLPREAFAPGIDAWASLPPLSVQGPDAQAVLSMREQTRVDVRDGPGGTRVHIDHAGARVGPVNLKLSGLELRMPRRDARERSPVRVRLAIDSLTSVGVPYVMLTHVELHGEARMNGATNRISFEAEGRSDSNLGAFDVQAIGAFDAATPARMPAGSVELDARMPAELARLLIDRASAQEWQGRVMLAERGDRATLSLHWPVLASGSTAQER